MVLTQPLCLVTEPSPLIKIGPLYYHVSVCSVHITDTYNET